MASAAGRVVQTIRKHVPSIRFPNRIRQTKSLQGDSPDRAPVISSTLSAISRKVPLGSTIRPAAVAPTRTASNLDDLTTYQSLPARYRRRPLTQEEMDYIERGGPE